MINVVDLSKSWKIKIVMWKNSSNVNNFSLIFFTIFPFFAFKEKLS